jgi:selenocysteine lyase/cysteine desulfurase
MGLADNVSLEGIRISQGHTTTDEEIDLLLEAITEVLKFL